MGFENITKTLSPSSAKQFLGSVQPESMTNMAIYVAVLSVLGLIGTVIGLSVIGVGVGYGPFSATVKWPIQWSVMSGIFGLISTVVGFIGGSIVFSMLSQNVVGRQVSQEEAITLGAYAATPALLAGIFNAIPGVGWVVTLLAGIYSLYLLYMGAMARFGQDKAIISAIVLLVMIGLAAFIVGMILNIIMLAMYNPFSMGSYGASLGGISIY
jgi:hypothetical protein